MIEKPILFAPQSVRAILEGRKTMTRRVLKPQPLVPVRVNGEWYERQGRPLRSYQVGDRLWVREAWRTESRFNSTPPAALDHDAMIYCEAEDTADLSDGFWGKLRPGRFMPRWASRITLEVTAVKVERLQDISEEDAFNEGVGARMEYLDGMPVGYGEIIPVFRELWESLHGPGSWDRNDWVAAYTFRRI